MNVLGGRIHMRLIDIIKLGRNYLFLGIILAVIVLGFQLFLNKNKEKEWGKIIGRAILACYFVIVVGATFIGRVEVEGGYSKIVPLFYSYKDAWVNFTASAWRNIVLNIAMFIPLGFLVPFCFKKLKSLWKVAACGFGATLLIETLQLITNRGIFEIDDLLNNTVGTMIGYGFYVLVTVIYYKAAKQEIKGCTWKKAAIFQLPLFLTVLAFGTIFYTYAAKEVGNLRIQPVYHFDSDQFEVSLLKDLPEEEEVLPVYRCKKYKKEEAVAYGQSILSHLGTSLNEEENDYYDDAVFLRAPDRFHISIDYQGGTFRLIDFHTLYGQPEIHKKTDATEEEIREAFLKYGIQVPKDAEFYQDTERGEAIFKITMLKDGNDILDGVIRGDFYENNCFGEIYNQMIRYELYKKLPVISPKEAYDKIVDGEFVYDGGEFSKIVVKDYEVNYIMDSKGFYQPYYAFQCMIDGEEGIIMIPMI